MLGLGFVLVPVFLYDSQVSFPGIAAMPPVLGAALLIWAGTAGPVLASRLLALRPVVWLGLISYSLYLWHWPIMSFLRNRLFTVELEPIWQLATVLASLGAGWLSWRFIEKPFRVQVREGGFLRRQIFTRACIGGVGLSAIAITLLVTNGAETQRFSNEQLIALKTIVPPSGETKICEGARPFAKLCVFGEANPEVGPQWLLWGDSHAASMLPSLIELAGIREKQLLFAEKGNCPPLPEVRRTDLPPSVSEKCETFRQNVLERVLTEGQIETVFLVARWPLYGEGKQLSSEGHSNFRLLDTSPQKNIGENTLVIQQSLKRLTKLLIENGKTVVIVQSVPELPWHVADRIGAEVLFNQSFEDDSVPMVQVVARQAGVNAVLNTVGETSGAIVVPVSEQLCTEKCLVRNGLKSFYEDNNHITPLGAKRLTPILDRSLPL
jgi:hypothetical protein